MTVCNEHIGQSHRRPVRVLYCILRDQTTLKIRKTKYFKVITMATASVSGMPDRQQSLLQLIECPICLNELQDPRLLSCHHIYCYKCLEDYYEKGNYGNALPCPQCREVTTLYEGVMDNLPNVFFMNELKEVVMAENGVKEDKPQKHGGVVCSTEDCDQLGLKYCKQCEYLCQQCYHDHSKSRVTETHQVFQESEDAAFTMSKVPPSPSCHRHKHYVMDLYCLTCNMPVCVTCSQGDHRGHECYDLEKQAEMCKVKLEQICEATDGLIAVVKKAIYNTKCQEKQAEADICDACDYVKSTFKITQEKLNKEETKILSDLQNIRRRVKKIIDATIDSQMMILAITESLKSCQVKLVKKNNAYDYSTVTDIMQRDVEKQFSKVLPSVNWKIDKIGKNQSGASCYQGEVDLVESVVTHKVAMAGSVVSDKQVKVTGSVASDKQVEVTGSVVSDKQVAVTGSVASDKQVEVTGSVVSDKQVEVTGSVVSDKQVEVTGSVVSDKQVAVTGSVVSDKQVEVTGSVVSYKQVEVTGSVASDKQVEVTGSVVSGKQVEVTGSVVSGKQVEVTGSVASDKQVEVTGYVASDKQVEVTGSVVSDKQVKLSRIRLHAQDKGYVFGMVVYHQRVYVVHWTDITVYCYTPDGSLSNKYEHKGGVESNSVGMCLMTNGATAKLVISDLTNKSLIWISIRDDVTMDHHHTQKLNYEPWGSHNDRMTGDLMVCDPHGHRIHRYRHDGQTLAVINLAVDVWPYWVTRHGDGDQYVVCDWYKNQVVMIDRSGQVKTRYKGDIHGVELGWITDVTTDPHRGVLVADWLQNQVLLLRRTGDVVSIMNQHMPSPRILYLDTDHHRLYVSGKNKHEVHYVFVFNYTLMTCGKELTMKITKLEMKVEI